jgi:hypothetical protein
VPEYNAGEARLRIVPDATGFSERLKADLRRINPDLTVDINTDLKRALADVERFRAEQGKNAIRIPVEIDEKQIRDGVVRAKRELDKAAGSRGLVLGLNLGAAGLSLIPGAVTGLVDLAAALQQVSQVGLAVPGALAGVGYSIGTLAVGLSGISDAYKEISKAASTAGVDQATQARAAAQAQQQLRNAAVDDATAHKDLARAFRDARTELEDLNIEARSGQISEAQAVNDALKARRDLARGGFKDQLEYNDALLRVASADQRVVETHQRNIETQNRLTEANAKGIDNSDKVVAAQERAVRADQQLADAHQAADLATTKMSSSAMAAAAAMAKLSPNARDVVNTLVALTPVMRDFRNAISDTLLTGISGQIRTLVATDLPILQQGMTRIASALNANFKTLFGSLGSTNSQTLLDRILGNTADAQRRSNAMIDPLVRAIGTLTAAGSDTLPRMADDLARVTDHFAAFLQAADKDGRLDKWINDGITGFEHLASILGNLGSAFASITRAAGGGEGLLGNLDKLTGKLAEFLKSDQGQQQLRDFFNKAREDLHKWQPILEALPGLFSGVLDAAQKWADVIVPPVAKIADFLSKYPNLLSLVVQGFVAFKTLSFATNIIGEFDKISMTLGAVGTGKNAGGGKGLLGKLGVAAAILGALSLFDSATSPTPDTAPSTGDALTGLGANVGSGALLGAQLGGAPGAAIGAAAGAAAGAADAVTGDLNRQKAASQQRAAEQAQQHANDTTGPYAPPAVPAGGGPQQLAQMIREGRFPGYSLTPEGKIMGPDGKIVEGLSAFAAGGPTPSGRGNGPTGGWLAEVHSNEWVLPAHARAAIGDKALWAMTANRSFDAGGFIGPFGDPVTPGAMPGPAGITGSAMAPAAPRLGALFGGGGLGAMVGAALNGGVTPTAPTNMLPGVFGLAQAAASSNPQNAMAALGGQTADYLSNFAQKTLGSAGSTLLNGGLSAFGLQNSILSPNNPYFQAGASVGQYFLGSNGPLAPMLQGGMNGGGGGAGGLDLGSPSLGTQSIGLGDGNAITVPTFGTSGGGNLLGFLQSFGGGGGGTQQGALVLTPGNWAGMDALGARFGLSMTSGFRSPNGPTIAGVPAAKSYHATGRAHDYSNGRQTKEELAFATYIAQTYGPQIKELIFDYPGFGMTINNGRVVGPFGAFYTLAQAGDHSDHVHVAFAGGGAAAGPGGPHADMIPAYLSSGEHVLTAEDVSAMGGQDAVYKFRGALHRAYGGDIPEGVVIPPPKPNFDPGAGAQKKTVPMPTPAKVTPGPAPTPRGAAPLPPPAPAKILPAPIAAPGEAPDVNGDQGIAKSASAPLTGMGLAPASSDHVLPALSTGIMSTASVIGNIVSTAISAAGAGAGGGAGGMGAGQAGALAAGLITEGGKIAVGLANVGSSFLVGNITGGTSPNASGDTLRPVQNAPITSPGRTQVNTFNGMDVVRVFQELDLRNSQDQQAALAHRPVR